MSQVCVGFACEDDETIASFFKRSRIQKQRRVRSLLTPLLRLLSLLFILLFNYHCCCRCQLLSLVGCCREPSPMDPSVMIDCR